MKKESFIKNLEHTKEFESIPTPIKNILKERLESSCSIPFPIITFKENEWFIATTPLIDVCAQGETEKDATDSLIAMIHDYMADPYTQKPKIDTTIELKVGIKNIPIDILKLAGVDNYAGKNTTIATG